jgi:hypothetical protein
MEPTVSIEQLSVFQFGNRHFFQPIKLLQLSGLKNEVSDYVNRKLSVFSLQNRQIFEPKIQKAMSYNGSLFLDIDQTSSLKKAH